jgi:hypothetical protein
MKYRVKIIGNHPHAGETGTVDMDAPTVMGMFEVELDPNDMNIDACYADLKNLKKINDDV